MATLSFSLPSCGIGGVDAPDKVCGAKVDPELLENLLPADDEYHETRNDTMPEYHGRECIVKTGEGHEIRIRDELAPDGIDPLKALGSTVKRLENPERISIGHEAAVGDTGIIAHAHCKFRPESTANIEDGEYVIIVKLWHDEVVVEKATDKYRKDLVRFAKNYFPNAMKARGCRGA
ncbi:hypothetical protein [Streptomyces xiaopingdaonensis]|uniref:hypothetical protein n=1 Tax=Streptomyces xiaopingdaonensis TaxID=1565415 RepID=UPI0003602C8E|nr:hypothetical protein [Streptomyces xiaopingdaonensis]